MVTKANAAISGLKSPEVVCLPSPDGDGSVVLFPLTQRGAGYLGKYIEFSGGKAPEIFLPNGEGGIDYSMTATALIVRADGTPFLVTPNNAIAGLADYQDGVCTTFDFISPVVFDKNGQAADDADVKSILPAVARAVSAVSLVKEQCEAVAGQSLDLPAMGAFIESIATAQHKSLRKIQDDGATRQQADSDLTLRQLHASDDPGPNATTVELAANALAKAFVAPAAEVEAATKAAKREIDDICARSFSNISPEEMRERSDSLLAVGLCLAMSAGLPAGMEAEQAKGALERIVSTAMEGSPLQSATNFLSTLAESEPYKAPQGSIGSVLNKARLENGDAYTREDTAAPIFDAVKTILDRDYLSVTPDLLWPASPHAHPSPLQLSFGFLSAVSNPYEITGYPPEAKAAFEAYQNYAQSYRRTHNSDTLVFHDLPSAPETVHSVLGILDLPPTAAAIAGVVGSLSAVTPYPTEETAKKLDDLAREIAVGNLTKDDLSREADAFFYEAATKQAARQYRVFEHIEQAATYGTGNAFDSVMVFGNHGEHVANIASENMGSVSHIIARHENVIADIDNRLTDYLNWLDAGRSTAHPVAVQPTPSEPEQASPARRGSSPSM